VQRSGFLHSAHSAARFGIPNRRSSSVRARVLHGNSHRQDPAGPRRGRIEVLSIQGSDGSPAGRDHADHARREVETIDPSLAVLQDPVLHLQGQEDHLDQVESGVETVND